MSFLKSTSNRNRSTPSSPIAALTVCQEALSVKEIQALQLELSQLKSTLSICQKKNAEIEERNEVLYTMVQQQQQLITNNFKASS